jgi:hypothetical protein
MSVSIERGVSSQMVAGAAAFSESEDRSDDSLGEYVAIRSKRVSVQVAIKNMQAPEIDSKSRQL